jgi:hypothetical protein
MKATEEKELDRFFQIKVLEDSKYRSLLGGKAEVAHHFLQGRYYSIRWWLPAGIPLMQWQHDKVHSKNGKELEDIIIKIKGDEWYNDLVKRKFIPVKYVEFKTVKDYLEGKIEDYV